MADVLVNGATYQLRIKYVDTKVDSFYVGEDRSKLFFAHGFLLVDEEGFEFPIQISDLDQENKYGSVGDLIEVKITKVSQGKYNAKFSKMVKAAGKNQPVISNNPLVHGTAAAIAMQLSVEYFKTTPEESDFGVIEKANEIFDWFKSKI